MKKPKIALIVYSKNAEFLYPMKWLFQFRDSILNQTYKDFDIFEANYDGGNFMILGDVAKEIYNIKLPTFVDAMNWLLDRVFKLGYDYALNTNLDDWYSLDRIEKQVEFMKQGYDIISSNFALVKDDEVIKEHHFDELDIEVNLNMNNNILCHPGIAYSKRFWQSNRYIPSEIPQEDLLLWKRAIKKGYSFIILKDVLCFHRLHSNSVCQSQNR